MIKKILTLLTIILAVFLLERFCHKQTDGFTINNLRVASPSSGATLYSQEELTKVEKILAQPLRYIGRGGQCYAFATADDLYVVKLLKYNNNYPRIWFRLFPFPFGLESYRQNKIMKKQKKLEGEYKSYEIALKDLQEETGIVFFHLQKGTLPPLFLQIQDKLKISHTLPADTYQFYIQKKGLPFYPEIQKMLVDGDMVSAKATIDELTAFLIKRCQKKITDGDDGIWRNFAFENGHPFQIDIGQFSYKDSLCSKEEYEKDLLFFTKDFHRWLEKTSPELAEYLLHSIHKETSSSP